MRSIETANIVDPNQTKLRNAFDDMAGFPIEEMSSAEVPELMAILMELRLHHLPPYRRIPLRIKNKLSCNSYFPAVDDYVLLLERELMVSGSIYFAGFSSRATCPECLTPNTRLIDGKCPACTTKDPVERAHLWRVGRPPLKKHLGVKRAFMAHEMGCMACKRTVQFSWLPDQELWDWKEGHCPTCAPKGAFVWKQDNDAPRKHLITAPEASITRCLYCGRTDSPYAYWGMCEDCVHRWQDRYLNESVADRVLHDKHLGPLTMLLVRSDSEWLKYLAELLPRHKRAWIPPTTMYGSPRYKQRKIKSAAAAGINLEELI